ncbi:hypothetical protein MED01_005678 [Micromonospora sp. MED01]|uniref:hypothetical protein n=1 Tax=Micromonospora alfalfae TaxID=2911212 RepID=UPI001EE8730A|nr:hypothetical protein [Micromonospora alfalfae]MCG5466639.1 hypothetical protein [Micromonospora alfalfae]
MKVFPVALDSGETVSLRLDAATVFITPSASRWRRLLRFSAGSVLVGLGLAAVANGVTHAVNEPVGLGLLGVAVALVVAGAVGAATAGAVIWRAERLPTDSLRADEVSFARSDATDGRVTVTVERADGTTRHFSATGTAGPRTAQLFARMLAVAAPTDKAPTPTP